MSSSPACLIQAPGMDGSPSLFHKFLFLNSMFLHIFQLELLINPIKNILTIYKTTG